jgi:cytoskeletal protein CcmA (bactofilin family)
MIYSVVEINQHGQPIGIVNLDNIDIDSGMSFYWNTKIKTEKEMRTHTISSVEAERAYHIVKEKFPNKEFEIKLK